ncbi:MAG TPA: sugar ABC transporter permease [Caldilineae bacterium]|nr:sugar ABC transporter permease [Caldilineae bacterium]
MLIIAQKRTKDMAEATAKTSLKATKRRRSRFRSLAFQEALWGYIFTLPIFLIFFVLFLGLPILFTFYITFFNWDGLTPLKELKFVGLFNYRRILSGMVMVAQDVIVNSRVGSLLGLRPILNLPQADTRAAYSYWHAAEFTIGALIGQLSLGLALALLVHHTRRWVGFARLVFFMPVVLPGVAINLLFGNVLYNPRWGVLAQIFEMIHMPEFIVHLLGGPTWLLNPQTAMRAIVVMQVWQWAGYYMILFLAGLQGIPNTFYEAAKVDGANALQRFRHVTIPMLRPTLALCLVLNIIGSMQVFTPVQMMTQGGPARATEVTVLLMFNTTFGYFKYSYGATMAMILFFIILILSLLQLRLLRAGEEVL